MKWLRRRLSLSRSNAHPDFPDLAPKQLMMVATSSLAGNLQRPALPPGYHLRAYRAGDDAGWIDLLDSAGFGRWSDERFHAFLDEPERHNGSHVVECAGALVAATFASRFQPDPPIGAVDFVVCLPEHRGHKLGMLTTVAVLDYLFERCYKAVVLHTDDHRLPALKIYRDIGFRPLLNRIDMASRWADIATTLERPHGEHL